MQLALIAYSLGIYAGTWGHPRFLSVTVLVAVLLGSVCIALQVKSFRRFLKLNSLSSPIFLTFLAVTGLLRHLAFAHSGLEAQLPSHLEGIDIQVSGHVASLPRSTDFGLQYVFNIDASDQGFEGRVLLSDYGDDASTPLAGQQRVMLVRLKKPYGTANPGAFDREADLFRRKIRASGYVRESLSVGDRLEHSLPRLRDSLLSRLRRFTEISTVGGIVEALVLGVRNRLPAEQKKLFAATGTSHLVVISGLHIGLVAGLGYGAASCVLLLFPSLGLCLPRQKVALVFSLMAAFGYSGLAGFTLPTLRALVMLVVFVVGQLVNRKISVSLRWLVALACVLTLDPLATQSAGFWFSFIGVAALMFLNDVQGSKSAVNVQTSPPKRDSLLVFLRPQFKVFVALLLPLVLLGFPASMLAPFINLIAIPVLGFLLVPLSLAFATSTFISSSLAAGLFLILENCLLMFITALSVISNSSVGEFAAVKINVYPLQWHALVSAGLSIGLLLFPALGAVRLLAIPMVLPILWPLQEQTDSFLKIDVVDVGQGLAVIVRTSHHALVYDTGNGIEGGFSTGAAVIAPVLQKMGVSSVDRVIISHGDTDHAGGLDGLLAALPTNSIIAGEPERIQSINAMSCHDFGAWEWDGVLFNFFQLSERNSSSNSNSCVLRISVGRSAVLLPGDIEKEIERGLVHQFGERLQSSLLIAPHHGSKTSSSYPFIKTVKPAQVVFSSGYRNRFNHPAEEVSQRYRQMGIATYNTARDGLLSFELIETKVEENDPSKNHLSFGLGRSYRNTQIRYWRCHQTCRYQY
ncbi:MAG: DNA internalization-related competence protein ComEC/Rec2 [Pseudohongiellaceae bacterium]